MKRKILIIAVSLICLCLLSGCIHQHDWVRASCVSPKTCIDCAETEGEALGHSWVAATCEKPQHCSVCGKNQGVSLSHNWTAATQDTPRMCTNCGEMEPFELPESGKVFIGSDLYLGSELTIRSSSNESCYIKLKGTTGEDVFSFFVRAGDSITVPVPAGYYYVYFSYGTEWFGPEYIFGPDTTYGKDDEICDFENYTWEYTLYPSYDGNFSETPISADEF